MKCFAISTHLVGQCVADAYHRRAPPRILPDRLWGDGDPEGVRQRCAEEIKNTARAAKELGVKVVNGFTGSPVWHMLYSFPPTSLEMIDAGFANLPIAGIRFWTCSIRWAFDIGLEAHPTEIAYDIYTAQKALEALKHRKAFGFNFDPSHFVHQLLIRSSSSTPSQIASIHVHVKDSKVKLNGRNSILGSHLHLAITGAAGISSRPVMVTWTLEGIVRALNRIGYNGPLSVEWEDSGMDREHGAREAVRVRQEDRFHAVRCGL